ncbi:MAG: alpha/beta fold hydrolase [Candidatus Binatus sp.]|uniref:alpha/beta fold hydrolase n=1 Tax=Candidatus Binatus sp. TaxID=2811406 RepID=UPI0027258B6F|nr:alpha/beta fold hydrolase [Candidatus Binatus sp.]MDO8432382.1 alpha/beta fold hydrolase [Candidatus Binatus sp.]
MSESHDAPSLLINGPKKAALTLVLAHGAGAPMDSRFMNIVAEGVADSRADTRVARFEFPYMQKTRATGRRSAPDLAPVLLESWRAVIAELGNADTMVIGGKSMGGRMASMIADDAGVRGLVCLGYPFHAPGRPDVPRIAHLQKLRTRALILQGTRDSFGSPEEVEGYKLSRTIRVEWIEDGDHSFKPRARSGRTEKQNLEHAIAQIVDFLDSLK